MPALVNSKPPNVVSRAPAIQNPPTLDPIRTVKEVTPVSPLTIEATGAGKRVLPEDEMVAGRFSEGRICRSAEFFASA